MKKNGALKYDIKKWDSSKINNNTTYTTIHIKLIYRLIRFV